MDADYDILLYYKKVSKSLGFSSLDLMVSTSVPWINYISWIFYFLAFKNSAQKISSLSQMLEQFERKHDCFQENSPLTGKGKYSSTWAIRFQELKFFGKYLKNPQQFLYGLTKQK
jgi:hypothetical protein